MKQLFSTFLVAFVLTSAVVLSWSEYSLTIYIAKNWHFDKFTGFEFWFCFFFVMKILNKFTKLKIQCFYNYQNWQFLDSEKCQIWFHVKSGWQKNSQISTLCAQDHASIKSTVSISCCHHEFTFYFWIKWSLLLKKK